MNELIKRVKIKEKKRQQLKLKNEEFVKREQECE